MPCITFSLHCLPSVSCIFFFFFYYSVHYRHLHSFPTRRSSDLLPECRPRIVGHTCRAVVIEGNRRQNMGCLSFKSRLIILLCHQHIVVIVLRILKFSILPVGSPSAICPVDHIDQPFRFARMIAVIVNSDQVPVLIEREFMYISESVGKDFKITSIQIGSDDRSVPRVVPDLAILIRYTQSHISYRPVEPAVRPYFEA